MALAIIDEKATPERHFLQMDIGGLPHEHFLETITRLAPEVKPRVQRLLKRR